MPPDPPTPKPSAFPETRWSLVLNAQQDDAQALAELCKRYWRPLYGYARKLGLNTEDAEDLTQAFFLRLLSNQSLKRAHSDRGKLRSFLLTGLKNYQIEEWRKSQSQKRGGGQTLVAIDSVAAEEWLGSGLSEEASPEREFDRCWARELMAEARDRLAEVYQTAGNGPLFEALRGQLDVASDSTDYAAVASDFGMSPAKVQFAAFKLRQRFREQLRLAVLDTVTTTSEAEEELHYLMNLFGESAE